MSVSDASAAPNHAVSKVQLAAHEANANSRNPGLCVIATAMSIKHVYVDRLVNRNKMSQKGTRRLYPRFEGLKINIASLVVDKSGHAPPLMHPKHVLAANWM